MTPNYCSSSFSFTHDVTDANDEDNLAGCFSHFVSELQHAQKLESLQLDLSNILNGGPNAQDRRSVSERTRRYEPLFDLLFHNIARCAKLKDIGIFHYEQFCPSLMMEALRTVISLLVEQKRVMNRVWFHISGDVLAEPRLDLPPPPVELIEAHRDIVNRGRLVYREERALLKDTATIFFEYLLSCSCLELGIHIPQSPDLLQALFFAAGKIGSRMGTRSLRRLELSLGGGVSSFGFRLSEEQSANAKLLLESLLGCPELKDLHLSLRSEIWRAHLDAIAKSIHGMTKRSTLAFEFGGCYDGSGKFLKFLTECAIADGECKICDLGIKDLAIVDGKGMSKFLQALKGCGGVVDDSSCVRYMCTAVPIEVSAMEDAISENSKVAIDHIWWRFGRA